MFLGSDCITATKLSEVHADEGGWFLGRLGWPVRGRPVDSRVQNVMKAAQRHPPGFRQRVAPIEMLDCVTVSGDRSRGRRVSALSTRLFQAPGLLISQVQGGGTDVLLQMLERACSGDRKHHR